MLFNLYLKSNFVSNITPKKLYILHKDNGYHSIQILEVNDA